MLVKIAGEAAGLLRDNACSKKYSSVLKGDTIRADVEAESYIIDLLKAEGLKGDLITEEKGRVKIGNGDHVFILDPLDGSTNYRFCIPWCNVSLAVLKKINERFDLIAGVIAPIFYGEPLGFAKGYGCFEGMENVSIEKGNLVLVYADKPQDLSILSILINEIRKRYENLKVRSLGSAALELAYTAMGKSILFADLRGSLRNVDVAAALGMLRECGGIALDLNGAEIDLYPYNVKKIGTIVASLDKDLVLNFINEIKRGR